MYSFSLDKLLFQIFAKGKACLSPQRPFSLWAEHEQERARKSSRMLHSQEGSCGSSASAASGPDLLPERCAGARVQLRPSFFWRPLAEAWPAPSQP